MNKEAVQRYVIKYMEATQSHIIEKTPGHIIVKFSPEADKDLTNRPYYWNFVERTGAPAETMTFKFNFDPDQFEAPSGTIGGLGKPLSDNITFGSRRLRQMFDAAKSRGRYMYLFEEPRAGEPRTAYSSSYTSWLCVNYKVEYRCDRKRDELHSLGISLSTGEVTERFHDIVLKKALTPRIPPRTHIKEAISLSRAVSNLETYLFNKVRKIDHRWAQEANIRLQEELDRIDSYYESVIRSAEEDKKQEAAEQYENRKQEIEWQYKPRVAVSVINCGIFHLFEDTFQQTFRS